MKPINEMNLAELADRIESDEDIYHDEYVLVERLRELHELTRWIPVSERFPYESDAKGAECIVWSKDGNYWRRIEKPEGV